MVALIIGAAGNELVPHELECPESAVCEPKSLGTLPHTHQEAPEGRTGPVRSMEFTTSSTSASSMTIPAGWVKAL